MKSAAIAMTAALLTGCYLSHGPEATPGRRPDAGASDAGPLDAGAPDAGPPFMPPLGSCVPPDEQLVARFPGDTQADRDLEAVREALFSECSIGEGCGDLNFDVGADGRLRSFLEPGGDLTVECVALAFESLCLPGLIEQGRQDVTVCGI